LPATQFPIGTQQVVNPEELLLDILKSATTHEAKISHVLLPLTGISAVARWPAAAFPSDRVDVRSELDTLPKAAITSAENGPKNAIARRLGSVQDRAHAISMTIAAIQFCQPYYVRSLPLHLIRSFVAATFSIKEQRRLVSFCSQFSAVLEIVKIS
jgi:hypothetical protein